MPTPPASRSGSNQAGQQVPSGYPSRRAIEFSLLDDQGDTLFVSGRVNEAYEVEGDPDLELQFIGAGTPILHRPASTNW